MAKFYAVKSGRKSNCICNTWNECEKLVKGYSGAEYKSFPTEQEAKDYLKKKTSISKSPTKKNIQSRQEKQCLVCGRTLKIKTQLCPTCSKKRDALSEKCNYTISNRCLIVLQDMYTKGTGTTIFDYIEQHPGILTTYIKMGKQQRKDKNWFSKAEKAKTKIITNKNIPEFIINLFKDREDKELIEVYGNIKDPDIKFKCLKCGEVHTVRYSKLVSSNGHQCKATMSSGEFLVQKYLKEHHVFHKTQFDTIKCVNPITKHQLPYDFELPQHKIIIEVQGSQHVEHIQHFHSTQEAFEYQQYKDRVKKEFATKAGYTYIEIFYKDIKNGKYKEIINNTINLSKNITVYK